ncbi:hypothetical protein BGAL_0273g00090 [Botrytis galanthina]|uniref:Serine aminopeptidase S33 domain-containing protein n=1 Tax=Botrytis galanthina TaxID=278940 RepID=A0A4S8QWP4_9HELO|nr:hypothetical protein BGAL_0273g00090 [Botrytis galanthina]
MSLPESVSSSQLSQSELAPEILKALTFKRSDLAYHLPVSQSCRRHVPVSAYIFWPLLLRKNSSGSSQIVAWAHGTPHFLAHYALFISGYVVIAIDYAGLGISNCAQPQNQPFIHHCLANLATANDVIFSIAATHFPSQSLGSKLLAIGHSQGGGLVWVIAQHNAKENIERYLGGVAISPTTDIRSNFDPIGAAVWAATMLSLKNIFLTEEGLAAVKTYREVEGGGAVGMVYSYHWHLKETR